VASKREIILGDIVGLTSNNGTTFLFPSSRTQLTMQSKTGYMFQLE